MKKILLRVLPMLFVGSTASSEKKYFWQRQLMLLVLFTAMFSVARGQIYVSAAGNDASDGKSTATAKLTLAAAITAIGSETIPYIKLGAGTFETGAIAVPAGVRVVGEGADQTTIKVNASSIQLQSNSALSNLTITRTAPGSAGGDPTISVSTYAGSNKITIKNVRFVGNRTAIYLQGSNHIVTDNEFEDNRTGLVIDPLGNPSVTGLVLERNRFYHNRSYAAIFLGPDDNSSMTNQVSARIAYNDFIGNLAGAVEINANNSASAITFIGNYFDQTNNTVVQQRTNGGFTVDDHNSSSVYPYNFSPSVGYPNAVSGANTNAINVVGDLNAGAPNGCSYKNPLISSSAPDFSSYVFIQDAVNYSNSGGTIKLAEGVYDERVIVNKELTIDGLDKTKANVIYSGPAITTDGNGIPTIFTVASPNVTIKNITFTVDLVKIHSAIHSYGNVSGIAITDNNFVAVATGALPSGKLGYSRRNAVSINIDAYDGDYSNVNTGITGVTIQRNTVNGFIGGNIANGGFRAGFQVDRAKNVLIGGDTPADGNVAQTINHDIISRFFTDGDVAVKNNTLNGGGLEMSSTNNANGTVTIESNTFNGAASNTYTSQARFQGNTNNKAFVLKNNTFTNTKWGLSIENFKNITIEGNSFTPSVNDFRLITVNTKRLLSLDDGIPDALNLTIRSNTFNGLNPVPALGKAIAFYNHKQDATNNYLNSNIVIGGVGVQNIFNADIPTYIYVDNNNGNATGTGTSPNIVAMASYPEYGGNIAITTTGYWTKNIRVDENQFYIDAQLRKPFDMTQLQRNELDGKIYDKKDDANIGEVQYYFPVTNVTTGLKYATIQSAIDAASAGDEINTLPGEYLENVNIDKQNLKLIGPGATLATIKGVKGVSGGTTVALAQTGVVLEGFTVTRDGNNTTDWNGALNNQGVSMNADNTIARKLLITGNRNGMYINNRKNVLVENCDITNNRTGVQLANDVSGTIVRNNNITNNWTMGVLYMDPSNPIGGFGQTTDLDVVKNNITGNWYSQIEFRTDNVNVLNFGANYLGAGPITVSNITSGEPGYAAQMPTAFGGSAIAPGSPNPYKICGVHSDKVDYSVALADYTDNDIAIGFQPDSTIVWVYEASPVATLSPKLTSASKIVAPNGTIVIKDATITSGGEITKDVTLDADATSVTINGDLTVNTTALTLAKATTVGGAFALTKGKITPSSTFILNGSITTTPDISNFINGAVTVNNVSSDVLIPIGKGSKAAYIALTGTSGASSTFTAEYFPVAHSSSAKGTGLVSVSGNEYWSLNRTSGSLSAKVKLYSFDLAASGIPLGTLGDAVVAQYISGQWETQDQSSSSGASPYYVEANAVSSTFGEFTFGSTTTVLPIELLSFTANATTGGALVKWSTAKEENNAKFEIEKSFDGKNFFVIDSRKGQGNSTTVSSYEFLDLSFKQSAYYRLVQVDAGGKKTAYTDLTKFVKGLDNSLSVVAYPNPVTTKLYVTVGSANKENVRLLLTDLTGKTLKVKNADSTQPIELDVAGVATGSYILQVIKDSGNVSKKILKL